MPAVWSVEKKPQIMADMALRAMILLRVGASAVSTPIWMPSEDRFAKPQSAYDVIVNARSVSGLLLAWIAWSSVRDKDECLDSKESEAWGQAYRGKRRTRSR